MSDKFDILAKVSPELKRLIKIFHVFDDRKGYNVLFITSDDKVFGFGSNTYGCCGLGHNSVVNEPQIIHELCEKNIKQFFIGWTFILALSSDHQLYGWGRNNCGQLNKTPIKDLSIYLKPENIVFTNETIIQVSCGSHHSLALTLDGKIYGWGDNKFGQVGCGKEEGEGGSKPYLLKTFENNSIKSIYCSFDRSFALTSSGLVYSWGRNDRGELGHEMYKFDYVFEPKLINISNVLSVCPSSVNTYFLTNEGLIHFCGYFEGKNNCGSIQNLPKLLNNEMKFSSLHSIPNYSKNNALAVCETSIKLLYFNKIMKTKSKEVFEYYSKEWNVCHKTIQICNEFEYKESELFVNNILSEMNSRFEEMFTQLNILGTGGFGVVHKVQNILNKKLFAIKRISIKYISEEENEQLMREVNTLSKCSAEYVVQYIDSWIEKNNCLYIQIELCSDNLRNVINQKAVYFKREVNNSMKAIEYYISCQLFKEVLECVQYLHESNPKIMHRDLKPENFLINENTKNHRFLKLCDFGLAKFIECSIDKTQTSHLGTPRYMAPEISRPNSTYTEMVDIYSLGIIALDLFDFDLNNSVNIMNGNLNEKINNLEEIITQMISPVYKKRPSCAHLLSNIDKWSIDLDNLIGTNFCYSQVFSENSIFKMYFNSILLKILVQNNSIHSSEKSLNFDITFVVNEKQIHCNKQLLMIKSQEFKRILQESTNNTLFINDLDHDGFRKMIDFLYFDENSIINQNYSIQLWSDIYKCGNKFKIMPLIELIEGEISANINMDNFIEIYEFAKQFEIPKTIKAAKLYIQNNFDKLLELDRNELKRVNLICDQFIFDLLLDRK